MAITAKAQWWIRTDGNNTNGAGFDSSISGAGTNYCDQASHQLSLTDLATSGTGVTTLTSTTGGFTSAMIGNAIHLASGTNVTAGYYYVTGHTDTNTVTLDRAPDDGVGGVASGVGKLGGAWADFNPLAIAYTGYTLPSITAPAIAGNIVNVRGSGTDDPATPDYQLPNASYTRLAGSVTTQAIIYQSYNGRAMPVAYAGNALFQYNGTGQLWRGFKFEAQGTGFAGNGIMTGQTSYYDCTFDQNGHDVILTNSPLNVGRCRFYNSGGGAAATSAAIQAPGYGCYLHDTVIEDVRGVGVNYGSNGFTANRLIVRNCGSHGIVIATVSYQYPMGIVGCTIDNNGGDGIRDNNADGFCFLIRDNIISNNGAYGYNRTTALPSSHLPYDFRNNAFYNNTTADLNGYTPSTENLDGDLNIYLTVDPFTDSTNGDYSLNNTAGGGAVLRNAVNHFGLTPGFTTTTDITSVGAVQPITGSVPHPLAHS